MRTILPSLRRARRAGFTLVELLTVIAIIAILASMLLVVLAAAKKRAEKVKATLQISQIAGAIEQYDSIYGRFPVSTNAQNQAEKENIPGTPYGDFTFGTTAGRDLKTPDNTPGAGDIENPRVIYRDYNNVDNREVIAILMDMTNYPDGTPAVVNANHVKNPQQTMFLNATITTDASNTNGAVGPNGVYYDPWGNPYIISMDLNYDGKCRDAFYGLSAVSSSPNRPNQNPGLNGLTTDGKRDNYCYHGKVMVWSAGPDGAVDPSSPANVGANKDNILSWQ